MLDHGMLNLPLAKRGCIDAQIDAYKAQKARKKLLSMARFTPAVVLRVVGGAQ